MRFSRAIPSLAVAVALLATACGPAANAPSTGTTGPAAGAPSTGTTGTSSPGGTSANPGAFRLFGLAGLTGRFANYGQEFQRGGQLAAEQLNSAGGVLGAKVEISFQDTANDPVETVRLARQAASDLSVAAIVGPNDSASGLALAPVLPDLKIVGMLGGQAPWNGTFNPWTFRTQLVVTLAAVPLAAALTKLNIKTLAITYAVDNDFSKRESQALQDALKAANIQVVDVEAYKTGDTDFSTQVTNIIAKKPDAWYLSGTAKESGGIILQARRSGYKGQFVGGYSILQDPSIMSLTNNEAAGAITWGQTPYESTRPEMVKFVTAYKEKYSNATPGDSAVAAYTSVLLLAHAATQAKSLTNRQAIRDALGATKSFPAPWSDYTYSGSGDNTTPNVIMFKVNDKGQAVPLP